MKIQRLAIAAFLAASFITAPAQNSYWTGLGSSLNWSSGGNWDPGVTPGPTDTVYFEDLFNSTGYTNVQGAVNNIVNSSTAVGSARYTATSSPPMCA